LGIQERFKIFVLERRAPPIVRVQKKHQNVKVFTSLRRAIIRAPAPQRFKFSSTAKIQAECS
jgi:hypothetical protein